MSDDDVHEVYQQLAKDETVRADVSAFDVQPEDARELVEAMCKLIDLKINRHIDCDHDDEKPKPVRCPNYAARDRREALANAFWWAVALSFGAAWWQGVNPFLVTMWAAPAWFLVFWGLSVVGDRWGR